MVAVVEIKIAVDGEELSNEKAEAGFERLNVALMNGVARMYLMDCHKPDCSFEWLGDPQDFQNAVERVTHDGSLVRNEANTQWVLSKDRFPNGLVKEKAEAYASMDPTDEDEIIEFWEVRRWLKSPKARSWYLEGMTLLALATLVVFGLIWIGIKWIGG
jgi:hypothetical protein